MLPKEINLGFLLNQSEINKYDSILVNTFVVK